MMKKLLILLAFCGLYLHGLAQKNTLVLNDDNKLMYYQVINLSSVNPAEQAKATTVFVKKNYTDIKADGQVADKAAYQGKGKLILYRKGLLSGQEEAQIEFTLRVEFKTDRYRIIMSNYIYTPLQRNRYGVFAPVNGLSIPIEKLHSRVKENQYNNYVNQIITYADQLNGKLHTYLLNTDTHTKKPPLPKRVSTKEW